MAINSNREIFSLYLISTNAKKNKGKSLQCENINIIKSESNIIILSLLYNEFRKSTIFSLLERFSFFLNR